MFTFQLKKNPHQTTNEKHTHTPPAPDFGNKNATHWRFQSAFPIKIADPILQQSNSQCNSDLGIIASNKVNEK